MTKDELITKLHEANKAYRSGEPIMSDSDYDSLIDELKRTTTEEEYRDILETLNEGEIEEEIEGKKVKHPFWMGSLHKLKAEEPETVIKFIYKKLNGDPLNVSAKIDGISCRLHYKNGILVSASTRGDGKTGTDVSDKIKFVKYVPEKISFDTERDVDIRGELVITKDDFARMSGFANPRNACAGIFNRKDSTPEELANITFVAYTILDELYTKEDQFKILSKDFKTAWNKTVYSDEYAEDIDIVADLVEMARMEHEYETDGLVITTCGYINENKHYPDRCMAFKLNQLTGITRLIDIAWEGPSKDGLINPVAILDPIPIGGSIISKASVHNIDFIKTKNLKYGSTVRVVKGGDIIPQITEVVDDSNGVEIDIPTTCPCCGNELTITKLYPVCTNKNCKDQTTYQTQHFLEKLEIDNVSFKRLQSMKLFTIESLLEFIPDESYKIETKFYNDLKKKMFSRSKRDLICATNFEGISTKILNKIFDFYGFENAIKHDNLVGYPVGVGEKLMAKYLEFIDENVKLVDRIVSDSRYSYVENETPATTKTTNFIGSICFTGSLNSMGRKEASILAERNGFEVKNSVTKGLTYLVMADPNSTSTKAKKAREFGTSVIGEDEFLKMMRNNGMNVDDL